MDETGSMSELDRRLRAKAEEDRKQHERIYRAELKRLGENLRGDVDRYGSSIGRAMESLQRKEVAIAKRITLVGVVLGLSLSLGILAGNLVLVQWQSSRIESLREEREQLQTEIAAQQLTLERLNEKTWGIDLVEQTDQRRFVVLPRGAGRPGNLYPFEDRWGVEIVTD